MKYSKFIILTTFAFGCTQSPQSDADKFINGFEITYPQKNGDKIRFKYLKDKGTVHIFSYDNSSNDVNVKRIFLDGRIEEWKYDNITKRPYGNYYKFDVDKKLVHYAFINKSDSSKDSKFIYNNVKSPVVIGYYLVEYKHNKKSKLLEFYLADLYFAIYKVKITEYLSTHDKVTFFETGDNIFNNSFKYSYTNPKSKIDIELSSSNILSNDTIAEQTYKLRNW